jgi:hypothetical protein
LDPHYQWGVGHRRLDLSGLRLGTGSVEHVQIDQIAGELEVVLPEDGMSHVKAGMGAGDLTIDWPDRPDTQRQGVGPTIDRRIVTGDGLGRIELDVHLGAGQLRVLVPKEADR